MLLKYGILIKMRVNIIFLLEYVNIVQMKNDRKTGQTRA